MNARNEFPGGVFADLLPGKRAGATVRMGLNGVEATTADGANFVVPYDTCVLEQGGASGKMIFCHTPDRRITIYSEDKLFLTALRTAGGPIFSAQVRKLQEDESRKRSSALKWAAIAVLAIVLLGYGLVQGIGAGASRAVDSLPISIDEKIGALASESMPSEGKKITDPVLVKAVGQIVDRLKPHASIPEMSFDVTIVESSTVNAYCLPGGKIVVFTGLLKNATHPDQVAGVLAHEMAHATLRHGLKRIAQSVGIVATVNIALGDVSGLFALAAELAQHGLLTSYGREQETASDIEGARMMGQAGLDPAALADFFGILEKENGDVPEALAWLSSHPQLKERQKEIRERAAELRIAESRPLTIDWPEVVRHATNPDVPLDSKR